MVTLHELVQAGLGDLDGHPERVNNVDLDADNLGRPWAPGKKRRDRARPTVLATSNTSSGATVSCEGDGMIRGNGSIGPGRTAVRKRSVGKNLAVGIGECMTRTIRVSARQLSTLIREAYGDEPVDAGEPLSFGEETELAVTLGPWLQRQWQRAFGETPRVQYTDRGIVLVPDDLPSESSVDAWIGTVAASQGWCNTLTYAPTYDVVNTFDGPGVRVNLRVTRDPSGWRFRNEDY